MAIKTTVDHIIVGQGLAGSCLALQLLNRGKKVMVFDEPEKNKASSVAAGLFNPITGKRMSKSWKADELFPYLIQFYTSAEKTLRKKSLHQAPIYRPFISVEEQNEWMALSENPAIKPFIKEIYTSAAYEQVNDPFGGILIKDSGYLDVNLFLNLVRSHLKETSSFTDTFLDPSQLDFKADFIAYGSLNAASIIFCDGINTYKNPFFSWLPIRPLKGETISVLIDQMPEVIFNRGVYLVPTSTENSYKVGATYRPNDDTEGVTIGAKIEMEEKLKELIKLPFQVTHQNWGIRPTTPDRKPILGRHPMHKNLVVFNGLGTKGVSLAPYFSAHLADWMEGKAEILSEVNIQRFKALYSKLSSL